jgi:hypothetical protein
LFWNEIKMLQEKHSKVVENQLGRHEEIQIVVEG